MLCLASAVRSGRASWPRLLGLVLAVAAAHLWATPAAAQPAAGHADVVLVLDASGSMFNELPDGRLRITAAKEALAAFVSRLPEGADLSVGLRVYGSRTTALDPGACEDSFLAVPVAGLDRDALLTTVQGTEPLGATPIAYSLERAAEDLQGAAGRKVIVIVTDGEESCGGDLRAVAERLAGAGFEIDLHVIGLALTPEAQRSFEGIGTFQSANSAAELAAALGRAVELPEEEQGVAVTVRLTRDGQPAADGATVRFVDPLGGGDHALRETGPGVFAGELPAGSYTAVVADAYSDAPLSFAGLAVSEGADNEFAFELAPAFEVELTVSPDDPAMGGRVDVTFAGASTEASAWITVAPVDAPDDLLLSVEGVRGASGTARVLVPYEEGELEARYHLLLPEGGTRVVGRSAPFAARRVDASLDAPDEVAIGASFQVAWDGPANDGDMLTVVPVGAEPTALLSYTFTSFGDPATLTAPTEAGDYEVRYLAAAGGGVLVSRPIRVVATEVAVTAPAEVMGGSNVSVTWQGPNGPQDMVVFAPVGASPDTFLSYSFTQFGATLELVAPVVPGQYEVRYMTGSERRVLASTTVTVTAPVVTLQAPGEVAAGAVFQVGWTGPDGAGDMLTIVRTGAPEGELASVAFTAWGPTLELTAPDAPGSYEVRYVSGAARTVLSSVPVTVR